MSRIGWVKGEVEGRIGVDVPFNRHFNEELKALTKSAKFDGRRKVWIFDEERKPEVMLLVERFYINLAPRRVTWQMEDAEEVSIDGATVVWIERDGYRLDRSLGYQVVERDLRTGGSRRYPHISGRLVIDVALRDGAAIEPEPSRVEEIGTVTPPNPASHFDDDTLVAELERRGYRAERTATAISIVQKIAAAYERRDAELWEEAVEAAVEFTKRSDNDEEKK